MSEDKELVAAVLARTPGAFESLVRRHQRLVWHMLQRLVSHPDEIRELSQDVFLRVHQNLSGFRFDSALSTWIGTIAFSVGHRHIQRKRLPMVEDDGEPGPMIERIGDTFDLEQACADEALIQSMREAIQTLPPLQRTIISLYHLDELSIAEVSRITDLPAGTIKSHLFRARLRLKQILEEHVETVT